MTKISMDKTYRTRDGRTPVIYTTEHPNPNWPVVGAVAAEAFMWKDDGSRVDGDSPHSLDLIEVKPEKVVWVVVGNSASVVSGLEVFTVEREAVDYIGNWGGTLHRVVLNEDNEVST